MLTTLPKHDVVLVGAGHTNAHVLRMWRMNPIPDARLTCVSNYPVATYSGMLPGVLAGLYPVERMEIDLVRLCASVGARLVIGRFTGMDVERRRLMFDDRPDLPFDVLSLGIGSVPSRSGVPADDTVVEIKPMQTFVKRLESRIRDRIARPGLEKLRVAVVGAGAGGVEVTFCLPARLKQWLGKAPFDLTLISSGHELLAGAIAKTRELVRDELQSRGVSIRLGCRVTRVSAGTIFLETGESLAADIVLWATDATAPHALSLLDLPKDARGFLLTRKTLQTTADAPVFAVGDTGTIADYSLPKAGVYAVRQGPVLWDNLTRMLAKQPLLEYEPQRDFLKLLNLGDGRAIAEFKGFTYRGRLAWKLKDWIDSRFMDKHQAYEPMPMPMARESAAPAAMRCAGCGGKVSGSVLSQALHRLDIPRSEHVLLGLDQPDDAAIVQPVNGRPMTVTVDFFAAPLDDPYLSGRLAALNSASDLFALGATPIAALAMATLPVGSPRQQEQMLYEMLAGSLEEFRKMNATLIGGHTIEGPQITIGFTMLADQGHREPLAKSRLREGDMLILTKPLGTGVLLAAHMQARCKAAWMQSLLESMLLSNQLAASLVPEFDIASVTDITGFGLAGHLLEMLNASDLACELYLDRVPIFPGAGVLVGEGIESTLAPANRAAEAAIQVDERQRSTPAYRMLFDPQTCGGLLLGVRPSDVDAVVERLSQQSDIAPSVVATTKRAVPDEPRIQVVLSTAAKL